MGSGNVTFIVADMRPNPVIENAGFTNMPNLIVAHLQYSFASPFQHNPNSCFVQKEILS